MTIKGKLTALLAGVFTALAAIVVLANVSIFGLSGALSSGMQAMKDFTGVDMALMGALDDVKLEVVQVQQFLSDISATRGQDGLDDGMVNAEKSAARFKAALDKAFALARAGHLDAMEDRLKQIQAAFPPYYKLGREMADAYVAGGPAAGNQMMEGVDKAAETLQAEVDAAVDDIRQRVDASGQELTEDAGANIASAHRSLVLILAVGLAVIVVAATAGYLVVSRGVLVPLAHLIATVERLGQGQTDQTVDGTDRRDEIAPLARALEQWRRKLIAEVEHARAEREAAARQQVRQSRIDEATSRFDRVVVTMLGKIKAAVENLHTSADSLSANAEQTQRQSANVSAATEQANANVETVSAAGTELMASIQEISRQVQQSAATTRDAAVEAAETTTKIGGLSQAAQKIGEIVSLINTIASQTNLLALNATIESARAGEAGKGFAVVANEVKNLAGQTSRATDEIATQIAAVQAETQSAVQAIEAIARTIDRLNDMSTAIAGAVEEQGAATAEISRNVEQASVGTRDVASNISGVAQAAAETGGMAQTVFAAANDLLGQSGLLEQEVERFLAEVRAA